MTIRGGGNPHSAMAAMPLREWTRRLGALPAEAYDCFMVGTPYGFSRIQAWVGAKKRDSESNKETGMKEVESGVKYMLDFKSPIQGLLRLHSRYGPPDC